jgi:hypothetical protein
VLVTDVRLVDLVVSSQGNRSGKSVASRVIVQECCVLPDLVPVELELVGEPADFQMGNIYTN